jgi:glycosyltransferase involved in cell wall biosynthesis
MKKIIHYYPRAFVGNGGVTIAVWRILKSLKKNYDLYIAYDQNLIKKQPLEIKNIKKIQTKHYLSGKFQIPSNFLKNFDKNTIIFLHSGLLLKNIFVALYANKIGAKLILVPHGCYDPTLLKYNKLLKKFFIYFEKFIFKNLFFFQAFTKLDKKNISKVFNKNKIKIIPLPIEVKKNKVLKVIKKNYFSYVGRYDIETKGLDLLIEAYKLVPKNIRIPIIMHGTNGKNSTINDVKNLVKKNKMEKYFKIKGPIYGEKKIRFQSSSLMTIQLSRWDAFPLSVWESISLKVPCLISDHNASVDIVKENNFGIVTNLKINEIKKKIVYILLNKKKIRNLIRNNNYINNKLSYNAINEKYNKLFI